MAAQLIAEISPSFMAPVVLRLKTSKHKSPMKHNLLLNTLVGSMIDFLTD